MDLKLKQGVAALVMAAMVLPGVPAMAFSDVTAAEEKNIAYVVENALFTGMTAESFAPQAPMSRAMVATVLGRLSQTAGVGNNPFTDVPQGAYYAPFAAWAAKNGIMAGESQQSFAPDAGMTQNELLAILGEYWHWLGRQDAMPQLLEPGEQQLTRGQAAEAFAKLDQALKAKTEKVMQTKAEDGVTLTGKLDLPNQGPVDRLVLFVNGSGPNTYENKRQLGEDTFQYFDLFAQQLTARGVGFFRWNTRGVSLGSEPPQYQTINEAEYATYLPENSVKDIGKWIEALRQEERLKNTQIILLGWSEGTIIAPLAAQAYPKEIAGLVLAGYCNERMDDILEWQQTGGSSMVFYSQYFDTNGDGSISKEELDADPYGVKAQIGADFASIDVDGSGSITREDFRQMLAPSYQALKDAVARGDDAWLAENYGVRLTSAWFRAHEKLLPNRQVLPQLSLPIAIFQGTADGNCDVAGAQAIAKTFEEQGKTNLDLHIYQGYDHDLNYLLYPMGMGMPQAFEDLFQTCRSLGK